MGAAATRIVWCSVALLLSMASHAHEVSLHRDRLDPCRLLSVRSWYCWSVVGVYLVWPMYRTYVRYSLDRHQVVQLLYQLFQQLDLLRAFCPPVVAPGGADPRDP